MSRNHIPGLERIVLNMLSARFSARGMSPEQAEAKASENLERGKAFFDSVEGGDVDSARKAMSDLKKWAKTA